MPRVWLSLILICTFTMQAYSQESVRISPSDLQGPQTLQSLIDAAVERGSHEIDLAPGDYFNCRILLTAKHDGLTLRAPEGKAILYGGVSVGGWRQEGELLVADVPPAIHVPVRLLIVNGQLADRARYPEEGHLTHETKFPVPWMSTTAGGWQRKPTDDELLTMQYRDGDIPATFSATNAEVTIYHQWDESCVPLESIDRATRTFHFAAKPGHPAGAFGVQRYTIWNTAEGMARAGQFYHDRDNGRLVYRPRPGESAGSLRAIAGTIESPITIRGEVDRPARDITLSGLEIQASTVPLIPGGFGAFAYAGAIQIANTENCRIEGVRVSNVAGQGMSSGASKNQRNISIENCEVSYCGAGGISVGGSQVTIRSNHLQHLGLFFPSAIGISRGHDGTLIEGNHVHDCTYSAITIGGSAVVRRNLIERAMTQLNDGAAIYATSAKACLIEENVCRDIGGVGGYARSGYYLDEQCDGSIVRRNIAINVDIPLHNHMARNCVIEENVFLNDGDLRIHSAKCEKYIARGNVVYAGRKLTINGTETFATFERNVLFSKEGVYEFANMAEYKPANITTTPPAGAVIADPQFMDVAGRDLRYRAGSPAKALGLPELSVQDQ